MAIEETIWMGQLPETWDTCPLKYVFSIEKRIAGKEGYTVLSITQSGIKPKNMSAQGQFAQDYSKYQLVYPGDFAMNHMDLLTGWIDISKYEGVTSPDYRVFTNKNPEKFLSEYYKYIFQFCYSGKVFYGMGQGVSGFGRWRLPAEIFLNFRLPVPSIEEQKTIVAYLDQQISKIDSVIAEANASIEEYKTWKASIIYEAVTKGLDPDVEMKDSGISAIGEIPTHWSRAKIRYLHNGLTDGTHGTYARTTEGRYLLSSKNVREEELLITDSESFISEDDYKQITSNGFPQKNDLLLCCIGASIGRCIVYDLDETMAFQRSVIFIRPNSLILPKMLRYSMIANSTLVQEKLLINQSAQPGLYQGSVGDIFVALPPITEQIQIVEYLDKQYGYINQLIKEKESLILDLESYKKSLIFEVVTGKRKVV